MESQYVYCAKVVVLVSILVVVVVLLCLDFAFGVCLVHYEPISPLVDTNQKDCWLLLQEQEPLLWFRCLFNLCVKIYMNTEYTNPSFNQRTSTESNNMRLFEEAQMSGLCVVRGKKMPRSDHSKQAQKPST